MTDTSKTLLSQREGPVVTLTMNRPDRLNALDAASARHLARALSRIESDDGVRCVVLRGAGPAFLAGGDVAAMRAALPDPRTTIQDIMGPFHEALLIMRRMPQIVVAAIHGHAAGAGASLAFATDLAIAAESSSFTVSYTRIGATPDGGATYNLARLVGTRRAMEIALFADPIPAPRALALGLVNEVVPDDRLDAGVRTLVQRICAGSRQAYGEVKRLMRDSLDTPLADQLEAERAAFTRVCQGPAFAEGVTAFMEKRRPDFADK